VLTLFLFGMAIFTLSIWQFWINLGIGGIIAILTTQRKKKNSCGLTKETGIKTFETTYFSFGLVCVYLENLLFPKR